jgi:type III restriction enzyme
VHKHRGINFCVDLSATPYFLGRVGQQAHRPFPWVVSDFGLIDAIESGLVKIPQLAIRDTTGSDVPGYFNIWAWVMERLTSAERGGKKADPKPEAVLKWAHHPIAMLGGLWDEYTREKAKSEDHRPPVFIIVCKNTKLSKVLYEWLAEGKQSGSVPPMKIELFRNRDGIENTIRVDSKVVGETDTGRSKSDEVQWMRFTLDTVGKTEWPRDLQGSTIYPDGFEALAAKLEKPLHPPGRDVRCIISVGMLTEGWDCNTVTHIVGLRPFQSQLLCEQVVGRGLRRTDYELGENGLMREEVAKVFGVPFEVVPMKANPPGTSMPPEKRWHVRAVPSRAALAIEFPRVERYTQAIRDRVTIDWTTVPTLQLLPGQIAPEVAVKGLNINNEGRLSLVGPGRIDEVSLRQFREQHRIQELVFDLATSITREKVKSGHCDVPAHRLFPQVATIVEEYVEKKVIVHPPSDKKDVFLAPYWGWAIERFRDNIRADTAAGQSPELPVYEQHRPPGSTKDVDYWTSRAPQEVTRSHVNYLVPDTAKWEQSAGYYLEKDQHVDAFVKNAGLGFAIPYFHNGQPHDYLPDFIVRLNRDPVIHLILETKGYDPLAEVKEAAAHRWVAAVNADGRFGRWAYELVKLPSDVSARLAKHAKH